jgi:hypothetical protein
LKILTPTAFDFCSRISWRPRLPGGKTLAPNPENLGDLSTTKPSKSINYFLIEVKLAMKGRPGKDRTSVKGMVQTFDKFFSQIPKDSRYHLELRTDLYLRDQVFEVLAKHGVGRVLSHWTWLPPLRKQLAKADGRFFNAGNECVIRLLTPLNMRYEDAYEKAHPFDRMVDGMMAPEIVLETVDIIKGAIEKGVLVNLLINNQAGGNAPLIAQEIAMKLLGKPKSKTPHQMNLWD